AADLALDEIADPAHRWRIGEVGGLNMRGTAEVADPPRDVMQRGLPASGQHHRRALPRQDQGRRLADAAAATGDPYDLAFELRHGALPISLQEPIASPIARRVVFPCLDSRSNRSPRVLRRFA